MPNDPRLGEAEAPPAPPQLPPIVPMDVGECRAVLARQRLCVLAVVDGGEPYAVPIYFGFDGETIYLGVAEGRKTRALDANSRVCVVVTEVGPGEDWGSVMVAGRATVLADPVERARAIEVLIAHNRRVTLPERSAPTSRRGRTGGRILRVDDAVITGRARRFPTTVNDSAAG